VDAEGNEQLMLYGLGLLEVAEMVGDFDRVRLVIHQPRLNHLSEWACSVADLKAFGLDALRAADAAGEFEAGNRDESDVLRPGEKQCRFCKAKATCPALAATVAGELFDDTGWAPEATVSTIEDHAPITNPDAEVSMLTNSQIARLLPHLDLIEQWTKAVRGHAEAELLAGREVPGYKVVEGRRGNRRWTSKEEVEDVLRNQFRLPQADVYKQTLVGPADIDRLKKEGRIGERRYKKIQSYIDQPEGKPTVVPETDKRPPLANTAEASEFTFETQE
jgi:hypothetical protein